jgi:hypothetical protein
MSFFLEKIITELGLSVSKLVGQGLDGASNMSGCNAGLCTLVKQNLSAKAIYIHCYAHRLNLALEAVCHKIPSCSEMITTAQTLYAYVEGSAKRHHLFQHIQDEAVQTTLKKLCVTRWHHRVASFRAIRDSYPSIITFLSIQDEETIAACGTKASVLLAKVQNVSFVFYLQLMFTCFKITNILNESFQKVDVDIVRAQEWVKMSVKSLSEMKLAENFAIFYKSVLEMVSENNIENETKNGRKRGRMSIVETSSEQQFKAKHDAVVDAFLEELNFRFKEENIRPIVVINKIISDDNLDIGYDISNELNIYEHDINFESLFDELNVWYEYKKLNPEQFSGKSFTNLSIQFINCKLHMHLPELLKLFCIYLSIPVSSAGGERSFSCLKLLKTYLRNTMLESRLSDLAVVSINSDLLHEITNEEIIEAFASLRDRKLKFAY